MSTPTLSLPRPLVRSALRGLQRYNRASLERHPFTDYLGHVPPAQRGAALAQVLHRAIWAARPKTDPDAQPEWGERPWRKFLILTEQYVHGRARDLTAQKLFIGLDSYNRIQAEAVDEVAVRLAELLKVSAPPSSAANASNPALHTAPPRTRQRLFGRAGLLAEVKAQLGAGQDVAVFGLPGAGKSTLLSALAYDPDLLAHFADGVLWAGLGQHADPFALLGNWALHLGLPRGELPYLSTLAQRMAAVRAAIGPRKLLLVIDDAWDEKDALALRLGGPNCAHVFSSRAQAVAQTCAGRNAWPVPELAAADGLAVLADQAPEVVQAFANEVQQLVALVGGLPLALRLMGGYLLGASRSGATSRRVQDALLKLADPAARLGLTQAETPLARHAGTTHDLTLAEVIGLSETFLDEATKQALAALSVFPPKPNSFDEAAALAVTGGPAEALDMLVDASLVEVDDEERYTVHPVIRDYAFLKLNDVSAYARMIEFFNAFLQNNAKNYGAINQETPNILAALQQAEAHDLPAAFVKGVARAADYLSIQGAHQQLGPLLEAAHRLATELNDAESVAAIVYQQGWQRYVAGDYEQAQALLQSGLENAQRVEDDSLIFRCFAGLGSVHMSIGYISEAEKDFQRCFEIAKLLDDPELKCRSLTLRGELAVIRGRMTDAEEILRQSLVIAKQLANLDSVSRILEMLGVTLHWQRRFDEAKIYHQEGLDIASSMRYRGRESSLLSLIGAAELEMGEAKSAEKHLEIALQIAREFHLPTRVALAQKHMGRLYIKLGKRDEALICLQDAWNLAKGPNALCFAAEGLIDFYIHFDQYDEAERLVQIMLETASSIEAEHWRTSALSRLIQLRSSRSSAK